VPHTLHDLREMLTEAGFKDATSHALRGPQTVIVATK
jgi:hypothetical protein